MANGDLILFDAGDGVVQRLAAEKIELGQVDAIVLSHLHADHISGLYALLALRLQLGTKRPITIYGPPGTAEMVAGMIASLGPSGRADAATTSVALPTAEIVKAQELPCLGETTLIADTPVTSIRNSHFTRADGTEPPGTVSCSFRIEAGDRSIVYIGDTGPSPAVKKLASGADLLVSEVIDVPATLRSIDARIATLPESAKESIRDHMVHHHLVPEEVARIAAAAKVKQVVLTHFSPGRDDENDLSGYMAGMAAIFEGRVTLARDLDRF